MLGRRDQPRSVSAGSAGRRHTSRLEIGTSIAVAFARNPMTVANLGWDPQSYSGGRFNLGLGTQVQAHIEKRFSMPWSHPVRRMRKFVDALQAIWTAWQDGSRLALEGEFYTHRLMTPMFTRNPCRTGSPKCSSLQSARR
jgi:probable F420-dependent oxidoreductase